MQARKALYCATNPSIKISISNILESQLNKQEWNSLAALKF